MTIVVWGYILASVVASIIAVSACILSSRLSRREKLRFEKREQVAHKNGKDRSSHVLPGSFG